MDDEGRSRHGAMPRADAARSVITAGLAASRRAAPGSPGAPRSPATMAAWRHRRLLVCVLAGVIAAGFLVAAWTSGDDDVLQQQLETFTLALMGTYFLGVSALAFWSHSRQRELVRITDVERYVVAVAERLGLTAEGSGASDRPTAVRGR